MMKRSLPIAALVLVAAIGVFGQMKTNDRAPAFSLVDLDGGHFRLSGYKGKVVLVNFWATWCTPCQEEMPRFVRFQREYGSKGFQVIGISMDDSDGPVRTFTSKLKVNYPVAMGTTKVAQSYGGVLGLPITYLIGRDGRIVKRYDGTVNLDAMEREIRALLEP
jgi:cytochrome c biogenesis protein CcmG, thiol:disulfide interchange protein DsbE